MRRPSICVRRGTCAFAKTRGNWTGAATLAARSTTRSSGSCGRRWSVRFARTLIDAFQSPSRRQRFDSIRKLSAADSIRADFARSGAQLIQFDSILREAPRGAADLIRFGAQRGTADSIRYTARDAADSIRFGPPHGQGKFWWQVFLEHTRLNTCTCYPPAVAPSPMLVPVATRGRACGLGRSRSDRRARSRLAGAAGQSRSDSFRRVMQSRHSRFDSFWRVARRS